MTVSKMGQDLHSTFPADRETLHLLKHESALFDALSERHHCLALEIYRIESGREVASAERLEDLKKQHLGVLYEVAGLIALRKAA